MAITHEHAGEQRGFLPEVAPLTPLTESAAGVAVVILAILGLANIAPMALAAIATIVTGGAFLLQTATDAGGYGWAWGGREGTGLAPADFAGGVAVEFLAGGAGIVLGILALLGIGSLPLLASALIIFGGVLLVSSGMSAAAGAHRVAALNADPELQHMVRQAAGAGAAARALTGLAAIVLGILALVHFDATILVLVGLLAVGGSQLLRGAAFAAAEAGALHQHK
jgi:hypothetical protein